ncbi:chaplin [Streptomyces sp. MUM 203J]|uniref:chaplin n=1 Tax=Streptomyces sp. MUM 203J TaxID=2791990 RepID=UPI0035AB7BBC|nr:chaplin [Streptomyces sp. MUM 203J]
MSRIAKAAAVLAGTGAVALSGAGMAVADAGASAAATNSPGVLSGNAVQVPIHVPVNLCGNTVDVIGLLNPAFGNACVNASGGGNGDGAHHGPNVPGHPGHPGHPHHPGHPGGDNGDAGDEAGDNGGDNGEVGYGG